MISSRKRLTWRTLRDCSERPFLCASSSSSTTIGRKMSCSSKRKIAVGSCISTFVSSTNRRRVRRGLDSLAASLRAWRRPVRDQRDFAASSTSSTWPGTLHAAPFPAQHALGVDEESAAIDSHVLAAVQALFLDHVEQLADASRPRRTAGRTAAFPCPGTCRATSGCRARCRARALSPCAKAACRSRKSWLSFVQPVVMSFG